MKAFQLLIFLFLFFTARSFAQNNCALSGKVTEANGKNIDDAVLRLLNAKDSSLVKYAFSSEGLFSFDSVKQGEYILKISAMGYADKHQLVSLYKNETLAIVLAKKETALKDVKIVAAKKIFSNKNGNLKIEVDNTMLANEANAVDLLSKLPTVQLSSDKESVSLVGKGEPLIYINNQKATVSDLNNLSVGDIKSIEILMHPSSKYEAEGRAVILVTRKMNGKEGYKADVFENLSMKRYFNNQCGINAGFRKKKLEVKANVQYNYNEHWEGTYQTFEIPQKEIILKNKIVSLGGRHQIIFGGGIYYQLNSDDYISVSVSKKIHNEKDNLDGYSTQQIHSVEDSLNTFTDNLSRRPFLTSSINYNKTLKKINGQLFFGGQYSRLTRNVSTTVYDDATNQPNIAKQDRIQNFHVDVFTGRIDFEKTFAHDMKYESGVSATNTHSNAVLDIQKYNPSTCDYSNFLYSENDFAVYNQLSGKAKQISYMLGVRAENTQIQSGYRDSASLLVDKNYIQLFPKMNVDIPIDSTKTLSLNYAKSIQRPNYSFANQISTYINPYFEFSNNINIRPSIGNELSANFQYKENSVAVSFVYTKDPSVSTVEYNEQENKVKFTTQNFESEKDIDITFTIPLQYKKWSATNMASASYSTIEEKSAKKLNSKPSFYFYSQHNFVLPKSYKLMLTSWLITTKTYGPYKEFSQSTFDIGVSKSFFKKLTCTISYNDMFRTRNYKLNFTVNNVRSQNLFYEDNREFAIAIKYAFGKLKDSKYKNKDADENVNRIK